VLPHLEHDGPTAVLRTARREPSCLENRSDRGASSVPLERFPFMSLYAYVANRPLNWMDPLGLCICCTEGRDRLIAAAKADEQRARDYERTGGTTIHKGGGVVATPMCGGFGPPGSGGGDPTTSFTPRYFKLGPCEQACTQVHEAVHADVCRRYGPWQSARASALNEALAYATDATCLASAAATGCLDPGREFPNLVLAKP
jgi:hypothetical protein